MIRNILLLLLVTVAFACGKKTGDPVAVVKAHADALSKKDFSKAKEYVTDNYVGRITYLEQLAKERPGSFKVGKEYIENEQYKLLEQTDSTAKVFSGARIKEAKKDVAMEVLLVKRNGKWLIDDAVPKK